MFALWNYPAFRNSTNSTFVLLKYRVSHSKVILLWWGYRFWFLLLLWILHDHEIGAFMSNSSIFIFLMLRTLYRMIPKNPKIFSMFLDVFWCFIVFNLWFKVKINGFDGLLPFFTQKSLLKVKINQNSLRNKRFSLIEP